MTWAKREHERTQESIKSGFNTSSTCNQHSLDDLGICVREGLDQSVLGLCLRAEGPRGLGGRCIIVLFGEADFGLWREIFVEFGIW